MTGYVCTEFGAAKGHEIPCKKWVEVQQPKSSIDKFAITKQQAFELSSAIVLIFMICYCYKIVERFIRSS